MTTTPAEPRVCVNCGFSFVADRVTHGRLSERRYCHDCRPPDKKHDPMFRPWTRQTLTGCAGCGARTAVNAEGMCDSCVGMAARRTEALKTEMGWWKC